MTNYRALSPVLLFITLFLGSGFYYTAIGADMAFYKISALVCIMPALFLTLILDKGRWEDRADTLCRSFANPGIAGMLFIFFLAGGFSSVTKGVGCVQEAVLLTKLVLPKEAILIGVFILSALISMALGTSMGVIGVLGPFVVQMASGDASVGAWLMGAVVSGAAFGDNLSLVSDTSIAASQTVSVRPKSKFMANAPTALKASLFVIIIYVVMAYLNIAPTIDVTAAERSITSWKLLPYVAIIVIALLGVPVILALFAVTVMTALMGILFDTYTFELFAKNLQAGFFDMTEVAILSFCLGGIQAFVVKNGGVERVVKVYKSQKAALWVVAKLSLFSDIIFANNTVAILFSGSTVKNIAEKNSIRKDYAASLMDIFATATQCLIPHGAQMLLASSLLGSSPLKIIPYCLYSFALYIVALWSIQNYKSDKF